MNVLVVAAHPDDEIIGVGGTIARHAADGDTIHEVIVAEGVTSRDKFEAGDVEKLQKCALKAAKTLGVSSTIFLGLPDNRLDSSAFLEVVKAIGRAIDGWLPDIVYTHHGGDLNLDHQIVHRAVVTLFRPLPGSSVKKIRCFETLSSTEWSSRSIGPEFRPNSFVDISEYLDLKHEAIKFYTQEFMPFPHPRSEEAVEYLARLRGTHSGVVAAEAFDLIFDISG